MGVFFWKQFLIAGGRVSVLEWKALSEDERSDLAQAGRVLRAEQIVALTMAQNDGDYLRDLLEVSEEFSVIEEEQQALSALALARGVVNARKQAKRGV